MLENVLETFSGKVFLFVTHKSKAGRGLLIKKHSENLQTHGDFSFPNTVQSWREHIDKNRISNEEAISILSYIGEESNNIIEESKKWELQVKNIKIENERVYLFLERSKVFPVGLLEALSNNELILRCISQSTSKVHFDPECEGKNCLTSLRLRYLTKVIQNLCSVDSRCTEDVIVTSKSSSKCGRNRILCGAVLNAKTGAKEMTLSADDFIRLRQEEMTLIAQHKYGVRAATDSKWKEFIAHLGESAAAFELLQIKPSSAVKINFDCSSAGSSKGAAFVLYNCARLETIIRTYNGRVTEGLYPALPALENTDFTLLTQDDEWCLVFNFVLGFPSMLNNSVDANDGIYEFRPHQICSFLCSMVRVFSQYYRRIRILTEPRKHLLPVMFARIHMLKSLNDTLKTCLNILNIKSVSQMYQKVFYYGFFPLLRLDIKPDARVVEKRVY